MRMSFVTIEEAQENLKLWLSAEKAVASGQSYRIGTRQLTRASLTDIAKRIQFWRNEVEKLESGNGGSVGARVFRAVPRDL